MTSLVKMDPDALERTIIEIRFQTSLPSEAVFGILFNKLRGDYPNHSTNELVQLPKEIREKEPNLVYSTLYSIFNDTVTLNIGPRAIYFNCHNGYILWTNYYKRIKDALKKIDKIDLMNVVERVGLRYINFFELDIYPKLNANIEIIGPKYKREALAVKTVYKTGDYKSTLSINNSTTKGQGSNKKKGSVLDIDSYYESNFKYDQKKLFKIINDLHEEEKKLFQNICKRDYLIKYHNAVFK